MLIARMSNNHSGKSETSTSGHPSNGDQAETGAGQGGQTPILISLPEKFPVPREGGTVTVQMNEPYQVEFELSFEPAKDREEREFAAPDPIYQDPTAGKPLYYAGCFVFIAFAMCFLYVAVTGQTGRTPFVVGALIAAVVTWVMRARSGLFSLITVLGALLLAQLAATGAGWLLPRLCELAPKYKGGGGIWLLVADACETLDELHILPILEEISKPSPEVWSAWYFGVIVVAALIAWRMYRQR